MGAVAWKIVCFGQKSGSFLRDGIASGRGVHRKWGYPIQKSRSNFRGSGQKSRKIGILGVGVIKWVKFWVFV